MTFRNDVLSALWSGKGAAVPEDEAGTFGVLMRALFPARTIIISIAGNALDERVLLDDTEVMPSLSLGDIVSEELNITVPYGTAIAFVPCAALTETASADLRGVTLGRIFAQVVLEAVSRGNFAMERELDFVFRLCASALRTVARLERRSGQISRIKFEHALASSLDLALCGRARGFTDLTLDGLRDLYCPNAREELASPVMAFISMSFEHWLSAVSPANAQKSSTLINVTKASTLRSTKI